MASHHYAIVLSAGFSQRMGTCKAQLPWGHNQTLLSYQTAQLLLAEIIPIVVLGPHNLICQNQCAVGSQIVVNQNPAAGKVSSILTGLQAVPNHFLTLMVSAVDQPRPATVYRQLLDAHRRDQAMIIAPTYQGRFGHPLLFSAQMLPDLQAIQEATLGLRGIVQKYSETIHRVECSHPSVLWNFNTAAVYKSNFELSS